MVMVGVRVVVRVVVLNLVLVGLRVVIKAVVLKPVLAVVDWVELLCRWIFLFVVLAICYQHTRAPGLWYGLFACL